MYSYETNSNFSDKSQAINLKSAPDMLYFAQFSVKRTPLTTESSPEQTLTYIRSYIWLKYFILMSSLSRQYHWAPVCVNIIGHLCLSKSAGLVVKFAFPMQIPCSDMQIQMFCGGQGCNGSKNTSQKGFR